LVQYVYNLINKMYSWVSAEFRIFFLLPYIQYAMLCYAIGNSVYKNTRNSVEFRGILRILRASLYNMYEFEYFKCKFVRIEYKISKLVEVESASFFLSPLIANPLLSPAESACYSANFVLVRYLRISD
jgi:hypothetical protein